MGEVSTVLKLSVTGQHVGEEDPVLSSHSGPALDPDRRFKARRQLPLLLASGCISQDVSYRVKRTKLVRTWVLRG